MLNSIAKKVANRLLLRQIISEKHLDIYVYGLELLLSSLFSVSIILIIGCFLGQLIKTICFLFLFICLRSFTGGYHANTYLVCAIVTFSIFFAVTILSSYIVVSNLLYAIFAFIGTGVVLGVAPKENPNKKLDTSQKCKFKIISVALFLIFILFGLFIKQFSASLSSVAFFTLLADIILLFIKNPKERRKKHEIY